MKISVVIPCYNQGEYLEDSIESAYSQTVSPHEILIVDDGSGDDSGEIADRYMFKEFPQIESPVRVIHQVNKGLPSARNTGIMNATGDYILFLDADDMLEENAIEEITKAIIQTNADVIAPSFTEFGKSDREVILESFTLEELKQANRIGYFCAIKRSVLLEVGGYNPKMKWGWEDYDLTFDLFKRSKHFLVMKEKLVRYRVKEKSMIHTANEHSQELYQQIQQNHPTLFQ